MMAVPVAVSLLQCPLPRCPCHVSLPSVLPEATSVFLNSTL